jgi:hypothetical protein
MTKTGSRNTDRISLNIENVEFRMIDKVDSSNSLRPQKDMKMLGGFL